MKAMKKMAIASVVVITLALTVISGITYSWVSDTEKINADVSTAAVNYAPAYTVTSEQGSTGTAVFDNNKLKIDGLTTNLSITVGANITDSSTIKTVYKIVAKPVIENDASFTYYDLINVQINDIKTLSVSDLGEEITVQDWTLAESPTAIENKITIKTLDGYGNEDGSPIRSYNTETGKGSTNNASEMGSGYAEWNQTTPKNGLTIEFSIIAAQGTYPYKTVNNDGTSEKSEFGIPANRIVEYSYTGTDNFKIQTATIDFSGVSTYTFNGRTVYLYNSLIDIYHNNGDDSVEKFAVCVHGYGMDHIHYDQPVILTVQYKGVIDDPVIRPYNYASEPANVISSTVSGDKTTIVFSITGTCYYVIEGPTEVKNSDELTKALSTNGKTVKLMADISATLTNPGSAFTILNGTYITLDLNGHTLESTIDVSTYGIWDDCYTINNCGTLRIKDSSGVLGLIKGINKSNMWSCGAVKNQYGATLTIDSGNFETVGKHPVAVDNEGTCTINGGAFYGDGYIIVNRCDRRPTTYATMTINGGYFINENDEKYNCLLSNKETCTMKIYNGTFRSRNLLFEQFGGTTCIDAGEFTGVTLFTGKDSESKDHFKGSVIKISFSATWNGKGFKEYGENEMIVDGTYHLTKNETESIWTYDTTQSAES